MAQSHYTTNIVLMSLKETVKNFKMHIDPLLLNIHKSALLFHDTLLFIVPRKGYFDDWTADVGIFNCIKRFKTLNNFNTITSVVQKAPVSPSLL